MFAVSYLNDDYLRATKTVAETGNGLFQEAAEEMLALSDKFDLDNMKIQAYTEATEREYNIHIAQCELKCMKEAGTQDDLLYLEEAAEDGALAKFSKIIKSAIEKWKEFCSRLKSKIIAKIASKEARTVISKAEKKIKLNPILSKKKVKVMDESKPLGVIKKYKSKVDKDVSKTIKSLGGEKNMKTLLDTKESFRSEFRSAIAGEAALQVLTIGTIVAQLAFDVEKLPMWVDNMENQHTIILEKLQQTVSPEAAAAAQAATNAAVAFRTELAKEELNVHVDFIMDLMRAIKEHVMKAKGNTKITPITEDADDFDPIFHEEDYAESGDVDDLFSDFDSLNDDDLF